MALRKFKDFIRDQRLVAGREHNILKESADDVEITDAISVIIGSELLGSERKALCDGFVNDVKKICQDGHSIMAIAIALK
jgi:hypothetical protein